MVEWKTMGLAFAPSPFMHPLSLKVGLLGHHGQHITQWTPKYDGFDIIKDILCLAQGPAQY